MEGEPVTPAKYMEYNADDSDSSPPAPEDSSRQPRRLSKDDSLSSSNSDWQPSGDEYTVYYYDPKAISNGQSTSADKHVDCEVSKEAAEVTAQSVLQSIQGVEDHWDILFARAEGLHAHGHVREACILGVQLAEEMLVNPPDLMIEVPQLQAKGKRKKVNYSHSIMENNLLIFIYCSLFINIIPPF